MLRRLVPPLSAVLLLLAIVLPLRGEDHHVVIVSIDGFPAYLLDDDRAPIPTIRRLADAGVAADGMQVTNPSITWPSHTTMVTGVHPDRHSVLLNGLLIPGGPGEPTRVDPRRDQAELVAVPTLLDVAHQAGLRTAEINWPCTRGSSSLDDSFPDVPEQVTHMTPRLREELLAAGILRDETDATFMSDSPAGRDRVWTEAARHVIVQRQPHLLLVHLLNVDAVHHRYGPQTWAGYTAMAYADTQVAQLLEALDEAGIRERTTVLVVSDHGFISTPRTLMPNALLRQEGLLSLGPAGRIEDARLHVVAAGGMALVYATDLQSREQDLQRARELFADREGIARVLEPHEYADYGMPHPRLNPRMGQLVLAAEEGYGFSGRADLDEWVADSGAVGASLGHHGFLSSHPKMNAAFVAHGRAIRQGVELGLVHHVDLAPTAARLLGLELDHADGRVLTEILEP